MRGRGTAWRGVGWLSAALVGFAMLVGPSIASGHLERPSYWPDPAPDTSVSPAAGGEVPVQRRWWPLVTERGAGEVLVVCQGLDGRRSMRAVRQSVRRAQTKGFRLRPSQAREFLNDRQAARVIKVNSKLRPKCGYDSIQQAVFDAGNNDRIAIMPGRYREPESRRQPTNDPKCEDLTQEDGEGRETPSVEYHATCPNDQNLVYIQGRAVKGEPPSPPLDDRHGIPDAGRCLRCNLQIEGTGVKPTDVVVDAGTTEKGNERPAVEPRKSRKDVVIRGDRADGLVVANLLVRGAHEHGLYIEEVDGYLINMVKMYWNYDYGNLTFTSDHGIYKNCDGFGSGDAVLYPGAAPETGEQADDEFYPDAPRFNTVVKRCDMRGSALGYSGSMGNAVRITRNHIYGNGTGIVSDTISASGHPGFPLDSMKIDHNWIYSNNLNLYQGDPPVEPTVGVPSGLGILIAGGNNIDFNDNWIFDNWFRGTMLLAIPDALVEPEGEVEDGISCETAPAQTTSCGNRYFDNKMGRLPAGFKFPAPGAIYPFPGGGPDYSPTGPVPNGVDFWWDEFPTNTRNCWFNNTGRSGNRSSLTADPIVNPGPPGTSAPGFLPEDCGTSVGSGDAAKEAVLVDCSMYSRGDTADDFPACDWYEEKPKPTSARFRREQRERQQEMDEFNSSETAARMREQFERLSAFADRP